MVAPERLPSPPAPPPAALGGGNAASWVQASFDELGHPLRQTTFVVVDLETTGGSVEHCAITEIGAVKIRGGEVLGEFATLIDPGMGIPPFIALLTGITDTMVTGAPRIENVLPTFLEFCHGAVLVAHNAPFDVGFLRAACTRHGYEWPAFHRIDTAALARRVLPRGEAPNYKLITLARFFRSETTPCHRALADAKATVDVLHGLLERLGNLGVHTLEELETFSAKVSETQRRKRYLAAGLPSAPGVYLFYDGTDRPLYVGTSRDIRSRVRQYFVASETRSRMAEMIAVAERIDAVVCAHPLEAEVLELRLIAAHKPPYNRRSKHPERTFWLRLTDEAYPRLSVVRNVHEDGTTHLGPFTSKSSAEAALAAVYDAIPLRQCTTRLSTRRTSPACALAEMGRCEAPCQLAVSVDAYSRHATAFVEAVTGDPSALVERVLARIDQFSTRQRYEEAGRARNQLFALLRTLIREQRLTAFTAVPELVGARPDAVGGWEIAVVRHGRLAAAGTAPPGANPATVAEVLVAAAETVVPGPGPTPCATMEETERILAWLERPETRLLRVDAPWVCPARGAERWRELLERIDAGRRAAIPFSDYG